MGFLGDIIDGVGEVLEGVGEVVDSFVEGYNSAAAADAANNVSYIASTPEPQVPVQQPQQPAKSYSSTPSVISTMEEMQSFLSDLERHCVSTAVTAKTAIQSQMLVINNIQSPTLVDTAFDTLILNLRKSLKVADELEREELREVYSLMIQNYVFFMDAKYQAQAKSNREESRALLEQAGLQLSRSVGQVACLATGIPDGGMVIENLFDEEVEQTTLWSRVIKWWNKQANQAEAEENFVKSIFAIIKKLDKYHEVIGPSMLIAGLIDRYKGMVAQYAYQDSYAEAQALVDEYTPGANASIFLTRPWATIIVLILTSIWDFIVWAFVGGLRGEGLFGFDPKFPTGWVIAGLALTAFVEYRSMSKAKAERDNCRAIVQENTQRMNQIQEEYANTLQDFERVQQYFEDVV